MSVLDAFSTYTPEHPIARVDTRRYVLAPPASGEPGHVTQFRLDLADHPQAAGGLYPLLLLNGEHLAAELEHDWWCGLVLRVEAGGASLADGLASDLLAHPTAADLPVVVDCGYAGFSHPEQLVPFMAALPPRPVILTHGGQLNVSGLHLDAAEMLFETYDYTLLETSGIYRQDFLERMVAELGYTRVLYGSGYPLMDERLEIERVRVLPAADDQKAAMLGGNARRVFGI